MRGYVEKHRLQKGDKFKIPCNGIPKEYIPEDVLETLGDDSEVALASQDIVTWAKYFLDWHCLDPDGEVWKEKTENGTLPPQTKAYNLAEAVAGKSPFHRPYQRTMLACTSRRKVFRLGRQCLEQDEFVYTPSGPIRVGEVREGTKILGGTARGVYKFKDDLYEIEFFNGLKIKANGEHPFYVDGKSWVHTKDLTLNDWVEFNQADRFNFDDIATDPSLGRLMGFLASDGHCPTSFGQIPSWSREALQQFVIGYFQGNGYISSHKRPKRSGFRSEIGFAIGNSERKAYEFQFVLWKLGITSTIKKEWMKKSKHWFYRILVCRYNDKQLLLSFLDKSKYPEKFEEFEQRQTYEQKSLGITPCQNGYISKIKSIKYLGKGTVVGWETEGNNEIVSYCGMRTHNSGKTTVLVITALFYMWNNENFNIVLIAPYQSQVDLIFNRLNQFIRANPLLYNSILRNVKGPNYQITLKNGSGVIGFTAGSKSAQDAGSARGQSASMLLLEEADMLSAGDINASLAVITNFPEAIVLVSSTPTGKRERYYEMCHDALMKEFYYPSQVNPNWTEDLENFYRSQLTEEGYKHEISALFSIQEEGVYQQKYIQAAQEDYQYGSFRPSPNWIYMFGVDWNDVKIGTTIAIIGWNANDKKFYLVDKEIISKSNMTQLAACQKIAELNRIWRPNYIYVDRGYGHAQIEMLHDFGGKALIRYGADHPDARLRNKVKGFDFGGNVEVFDLFTKEKIKKPAKPFLVENSVRRFENFEFKFPKDDIKLAQQLSGYIIERVSQSGRPIYAQQDTQAGGDHLIDAINLALAAFVLEETPWGKKTIDTDIKVSESLFSTLKSGSKEREIKIDRPPGRLGILNSNDNIIKDPSDKLPVVNAKEKPAPLWDWPGFLRDAPRPQRNTRRPLARSYSGPPRRKKF